MVKLQTSQHMEITSGGNPKWPGEFLSFSSDLWGGCVSDKQITRESGVLDLLQAGDNVMVDRGFHISTIVPDGVSVNVPPFLAGGDQMTAA